MKICRQNFMIFVKPPCQPFFLTFPGVFFSNFSRSLIIECFPSASPFVWGRADWLIWHTQFNSGTTLSGGVRNYTFSPNNFFINCYWHWNKMMILLELFSFLTCHDNNGTDICFFLVSLSWKCPRILIFYVGMVFSLPCIKIYSSLNEFAQSGFSTKLSWKNLLFSLKLSGIVLELCKKKWPSWQRDKVMHRSFNLQFHTFFNAHTDHLARDPF